MSGDKRPAKTVGVNTAHDLLEKQPYFDSGDNSFINFSNPVERVVFAYCGTGKCAPQNPTHLQPNFALFLARLASYLRDSFGVTEIDHLGIYPGNGSPDDVHNRGAAIDLSGVKTQNESLTVKSNWPNPIFDAIYAFSAHEATDKSENPFNDLGPPSNIGDHSYIITPAHPTLGATHQNHMHIQIGQTIKSSV